MTEIENANNPVQAYPQTHPHTRPKALIFDLDGTLAPSKAPVSDEMSKTLLKLLDNFYVVVISGGFYDRFRVQILDRLKEAGCSEEKLSKLILFPQNGSDLFVYKRQWSLFSNFFFQKKWSAVYEENLSKEERKKLLGVVTVMRAHFGIPDKTEYGNTVEDRGAQVSVSMLGQQAPLSVKEPYDPDQSKRKEMKAFMDPLLPDFEIAIGGSNTIDITKKGVNKAYAIKKLLNLLKLKIEDLLFFGDAIFVGGNDQSVKDFGVESIRVHNPSDTLAHLRDIIAVYE